MAPSDGNALMLFTLVRASSLDEAATSTLQKLELEMLDSNHTTVNGMPAIETLSEFFTVLQTRPIIIRTAALLRGT